MRAISLWQPWASLYGCGRKGYETRHWSTDYRGPLLIHAAKKICLDLAPDLVAVLEDEFGGHWARDMPRGAIVGYVEIVSCLPTERVHVDEDEQAQGNWTPGRFAWGAQNARLLPQPIPYIGRQGFFDVPFDVVEQHVPAPARAAEPQGSLL